MPYFCVECGTFQQVEVRTCPACGVEREDPRRIDPFARSRSGIVASDAVDELPEVVISRRRYLWFKLTRPWRRLWMRGLLWRALLLSVSAVAFGVPLASAIYWLVGQRCDSSQDVACSATIVRLVTPVSGRFASQLSEPASERDIALAAELFDAVTLIGLAWSDDQSVSQREIVNISAGDSGICFSAVECVPLIRSGKNVDYDGVSGSAYLNPAGLRGTHLANQRRREPATLAPSLRQDRIANDSMSLPRASETTVPGTTLSILVDVNRALTSEVASLAASSLISAGVSLEVRLETLDSATIASLGEYVVVIESAIPDQTLRVIAATGRIVMTVGSEWRVVPASRAWLRLSPHPALLAELVVSRIQFEGNVLLVGRCGDPSPAVSNPLQRRLSQRGTGQLVKYQCIDKKTLEATYTAFPNDPDATLVIATPYNPLGLYKTLLETGYVGKIDDVVVVASRATRLIDAVDAAANP